MMRSVASLLLRYLRLVFVGLTCWLSTSPVLQAQATPATSAPAAPSTPAPAARAADSGDASATAGVATTAAETSVDASAEIPAELPDELPWDLLHRRYTTWYGPTGGIFLFDGRAAEPGAVRIQFGLDAFSGSDYLADGDHVELTDQALVLNVAILRSLEAYATLSNRSVNQSRPEAITLDVLGDFSVGARMGFPLGKLFDFGVDLRGLFTNKVGGGGLDWGATSLSLRTALSMDLQRLADPLPILVRANVGYVLDNSAQVIEDIEDDRYDGLSSPKPKADETAHLITRLQRFAMNVNRLDKLALGVGIETPLRVTRDFYLHPAVEWQLGIPVNRQDYDCPNVVGVSGVGTTRRPQPGAPPVDGCYERITSSMPMNLAVGLRAVPPVRGLSFLVAFDIGLMGTDRFVRELTPNLPWRFLFAFSYDYDARPAAPATIIDAPVVAPPPPVAPVAPVRGRVRGKVVSSDQQQPVPGAQVHFADLKLTALLADEAGEFATEPFPPGPVALEVRHPDYDTGTCTAVIPDNGADVPVTCTLVAKPIVGRVAGKVVDSAGSLLSPARIIVSGPTSSLVMTDARGEFTIEQLPPGTYQLRIEAGGYFIRQTAFTIAKRETLPITIDVNRKPIAPTITFAGDSIEAPAITFATDTSTQLTPVALGSIAEIADLLLSRPDLYLQVQGFGPTEDIARTRALNVKQRLVDAGVPESHIETIVGGTRKFRFLLHR